MHQKWRDLLFLHWEISIAALRPLVPAGLEVDTYDGRAYVGLIPFTIRGVRPMFAPAAGPLSRFHETNLRTYVHREGRDPGVWFFSLDAASRLAVLGARAGYKLPYFFARMSLRRSADGWREYRGVRRWPGPRARYHVRGRPLGPVVPAAEGTLEHFLIERYVLYAAARGRLYRAQVHHRPYPVQAAEVAQVEESLRAAAELPSSPDAPLAHFASGVDVEVFRRVRLS